MPPKGAGEPRPTLDLLADFHQLFANHFMVNAFLAGTLIAIVAGAVGWFMVLRGQSFAGHTLAEVGFAGATGAALVGLPPVVGVIAIGVIAALGISALTNAQRGRHARRPQRSARFRSLASASGCSFCASHRRHMARAFTPCCLARSLG